jgi:hypothetical protein
MVTGLEGSLHNPPLASYLFAQRVQNLAEK